MPICRIIGGPNGAGKTTFAFAYLPEVGCQNFANADLIAAGLAPLSPERELFNASRLFLREIENHIVTREDFAFETTLSGRSYLKLIKRLQLDGWTVELLYLALSDMEMSKVRVAERVAHGGHNIPLEDIERRFPRSLNNLLNDFSPLADHTRCFVNDDLTPIPVFEQQANSERNVLHNDYYRQLMKAARS